MLVVHECPTLADLLTPRQLRTVEFIRSYREKYDFLPSVREIRDAVGVSSTSTVHLDLRALEKAGVIRRPEKRSRAITLIDAEAA